VAATPGVWHHWHSTTPSANEIHPREEYAVPTYQYSCTACGEPLEVVQSFTDDALTECPACGGKLRKLYNAVGIVFKGSGFYRTDNRSGSSSTVPAASSSSGDSGAAKSDSSKSDSSKSESSTSGSSGSSTTGSSSSGGSSGTSGSGGSGTSGSAA
jgi:putative FmdB family regulatory protein